jgi:DNA-binding response OmpR family regulator
MTYTAVGWSPFRGVGTAVGGRERMARIAVVEDERDLAALVAGALRTAGHEVETLHDGLSALHRLADPAVGGVPGEAGTPDPELIVLDLMLPGLDGLEVCRRVRRTRATPILMLTARGSELDRVLGLELGADDYLVKPFSERELSARVAAILRRVELLRRAARERAVAPGTIDHPGLRIDPAGRAVVADGRPVVLTAKEFDLLHLLASHPGRVFGRAYLLDRVWGADYDGLDRTVDRHVLRLRQKLGAEGSVADRLETLWGVGYKYALPSVPTARADRGPVDDAADPSRPGPTRRSPDASGS